MIPSHRLLLWAGLASVAAFIATLAAIPLLVVRIPEDYFVDDRPRRWAWSRRHPVLHVIVVGLKNLLGIFLLAAGVAMLFLPGQGVITILLGLTFMNFPGKRRIEKAVIRMKPVARAVNWMRAKGRRPPLRIPPSPRRS